MIFAYVRKEHGLKKQRERKTMRIFQIVIIKDYVTEQTGTYRKSEQKFQALFFLKTKD